jgi:hypothetical protein
MERIFKAAKQKGFEVFISPHYFFPTDHGWKFNGPLEADELATGTFARSGRLRLESFARSGADWLDRFTAALTSQSCSAVYCRGFREPSRRIRILWRKL